MCVCICACAIRDRKRVCVLKATSLQMLGMFLCCMSERRVEAHLWREAVADGGVDSVAVSRRCHEAVRVTREAVASGRQAVRRASILGSC